MSATSDPLASGSRRQLSLFDAAREADEPLPVPPRAGGDADADARAYAVNPSHHVVLEASAGTGKTSVLVARYVNLLKAGVDPGNILAITFTRKAAAEMRERIIRELRRAAAGSELDRALWATLRDRVGDVAISTIDAFCLSLLREFPLEADVDPGFDLADETEVPRLTAAALDRTMRILSGMARHDEDVALVLAQLGIARTRRGLAALLERRLVAWDVLNRFLARGPRGLTAGSVCGAAARELDGIVDAAPGGRGAFAADGPRRHPRYELFLRELDRLPALTEGQPGAIRAALDRLAAHFLTADGRARRPGSTIPPYRADHYPSKDAAKRHRDLVFQLAPRVEQVVLDFRRNLNAVLARGVRRMFAVALAEYRQALEERSVLDFPDVLQRAVELLRRMDEFSQSRFRLESRYHHVLVDEFQDTSRAQWELVSLLVQAWGEGLGVAVNPSIFVVGDRKQSIYRFRDADVEVLEHAARYIDRLRPSAGARRAITRSFRAVPELLHIVNDLFSEMSQPDGPPDHFTYGDRDRFPVDEDGGGPGRGAQEPAFGVAVAESPEACAAAVAGEVVRLLAGATVRDTATGVARAVRPADIAILFRSRASHREFERELGRRGVPTHVYKGLGFFDADEVKDIVALLRYLADPASALRAAAFLRSRFVRLSDAAIEMLAPALPAVLSGGDGGLERLDPEDRQVIDRVRLDVPRWLDLVDRTTPAELLDRVLGDSAYLYELRGTRRRQAWENVKKLRGLIRRMQNRGYPTLRRIAEYLMAMSAGDESNATVEALDAVNLMTVHASKGLEFPIVFVVNMAKGASGPPQPIRVVGSGGLGQEGEAAGGDVSVTVGPFLSEADETERERERHETRRLLYVALTRARDRLYLSTVLKEGQLAAGRGSLAEVLPASFAAFFGHAVGTLPDTGVLGWTGASGRAYTFRLCRADSRTAEEDLVAARQVEASPSVPDHFGSPVPAILPTVRMSARRHAESAVSDHSERPAAGEESGSDRLVGLLVHRLFEYGDAEGPPAEVETVAPLARRLLRAEEAADVGSAEALAARAAAAWVAARSRPDVVGALTGERIYEVPFSLLLPGPGRVIVRGVIDCVVRNGSAFRVVEFKTGRRRPAHERQLDIYTMAVRALHPGATVRGLLIYL